MKLSTILLALAASACGFTGPAHPFPGTLPRGAVLDMTGAFTLLPSGELSLAFVEGCRMERRQREATKVTLRPCVPNERAEIRVVATPPWGGELAGTWRDANHVVFHVDWTATDLRVLEVDAAARAERPWSVSGMQWQPTRTDAALIVKLTGDATGTETTLVADGPPPKLEVSAFELQGALSAGQSTTLDVKLTNRGPGAAFRVVATTRSSVPALHGQRFEFGALPPGATKTRSLQVALPADLVTPDAMVVLVVEEGNGNTAERVSHRWSITGAKAELATTCVVREHPTGRPTLSVGEHVTLRCVANNAGGAPATVALEVSLPGLAVHTKPQEVAGGQRVVFDVPVAVPRDLAIGSTVQLQVTASDARLGRLAQTVVAAEVAKAKLCLAGKLSRPDYDAKITELRAAVKAGDMTQAQLDRYDGELLLCLN